MALTGRRARLSGRFQEDVPMPSLTFLAPALAMTTYAAMMMAVFIG